MLRRLEGLGGNPRFSRKAGGKAARSRRKSRSSERPVHRIESRSISRSVVLRFLMLSGPLEKDTEAPVALKRTATDLETR